MRYVFSLGKFLQSRKDRVSKAVKKSLVKGISEQRSYCILLKRGVMSRVDHSGLETLLAHLLVFSVTPVKLDQNKNQNRSIGKVQNVGNERRYICKDPRQDSGQRNISYTRYLKKCFTQIYRDLYGDAMLVLTWMSSNMVDGNQQKHLLPSFATKA